MRQSPDNGQNSHGGILDFQISCQLFTEKNYHNSRTSNDIDVKLGPVTNLEKKNTAILKKYNDGVISEFMMLSFFGLMTNLEQFGSQSPDCKTYIFINSNLLSYKN